MSSMNERHFLVKRGFGSKKFDTSRNKIRKQEDLLVSRKRTKQIRNFKDLGLQGLTEAFDAESTLLRRSIWGFLWLGLLGCCITQLVESLNMYMSSPTNVNIRYQRLKTVTHPCVTFCPVDDKERFPAIWQPLLRKEFGNISYNTTHEFLKRTGMNTSTLWNMSRLVVDNLTYDLDGWNAANSMDINSAMVEMVELSTVVGVCHTFKSHIELPCTGKQVYLLISAMGENPNTWSNEYTVIFHSEAQIPLLRYLGSLANGIYIPFNKEVYGIMCVEQEKNVNSWNKPCIPEAEYFQCQADCVERMILYNSKLPKPCRLPFMKEDSVNQLCSTADEFLEVMLATADAMAALLQNNNNCNCRRPCKKMVYKEDYFIMNDVDSLFSFYVPYPKCEFQVIEEEYSYKTTAFIADIGGALGLYLGMSILSIIGILETLTSKLLRLPFGKTVPISSHF